MKLLLVVIAALAFPPTAWGEATLVSRDLPVNGMRSLAAAPAPERFNLLGLHWRGPGRVFFRVRGGRGWGGWHEADAEPEDLPDRGSDEARRLRSWRIGNPWWTGTAEQVQIRTRGRVHRVRAHFVWSAEAPMLERSLQGTGTPRIILRKAWGANERIRRDDPDYAPTLSTAVVHHTAGASPATPAQSAAIVRGIQTYHVLGNGWDDIGYNFLVDRFGQVFEGRYGGIERNVIGAHAQGFNTGSVGVALIGSYGGARISAAARDALTQLLAWRLDVAHVHPLSRTSLVSGGNPKFRKGLPVWMRAISGHRDTGFTSCPGAGLYGQLGAIRQQTAVTGLPKLYAPRIEGSLGGLVSFTAQLSSSLPWSVTIFDATLQPIAVGTGFGRVVQWTWDARFVPPGSYTYRISAGPTMRPATGLLGAPTGTFTLEAVRAEPAGFTPNGDGVTDVTRIAYRLGAPATVTVDLRGEDGTQLAQLQAGSKPAGDHVFAWGGAGYPDGRYQIVVTARGRGGRQLSSAKPIVLSRTLSGFSVAPLALSPNGDGRNDSAAIAFNVSTPALAWLQVIRGNVELGSLIAGDLPAGPQAAVWEGRAPDGEYRLRLTVTDAVGAVAQEFKVRVDRVTPILKRVRKRGPLRVSLSEPARVTFIADGTPVTIRRPKAGIFRVVLDRPFRRLEAFAEDNAANLSRRLRLR
jgi:N-acetylmuramoyl-L-alanine amidase/FlgD Ig-like domain